MMRGFMGNNFGNQNGGLILFLKTDFVVKRVFYTEKIESQSKKIFNMASSDTVTLVSTTDQKRASNSARRTLDHDVSVPACCYSLLSKSECYLYTTTTIFTLLFHVFLGLYKLLLP